MELVVMPGAHAAADSAKIRVSAAARVGVRFGSSATAMVQDEIGQAQNAVGAKSRYGTLQFGLSAKVRGDGPFLIVLTEVVIIVWIVAHGEPSALGFARRRKPDAVDAVAA